MKALLKAPVAVTLIVPTSFPKKGRIGQIMAMAWTEAEEAYAPVIEGS